jgi:hypothetical protein
VHLRIVFALGDAHIDMRMRMSCARGDGARPITESGMSACGSSTARSSSVSGVPSTLGLSAAKYGAPTVTRVPLAPVFFFVGCPRCRSPWAPSAGPRASSALCYSLVCPRLSKLAHLVKRLFGISTETSLNVPKRP